MGMEYILKTWISLTNGCCHIMFKLHLVWLAPIHSEYFFLIYFLKRHLIVKTRIWCHIL